MTAGARWTPAETAQLAAMFAAGMKHREIGQALGRSRAAINAQLGFAGIRPATGVTVHPFTAAELGVIKSMHAGHTFVQIASVLRRPLDSVKTKAREMGLRKKASTPSPRWSTADDEAIRRHYARGNIGQLAERLGRTKRALSKRAQALGCVVKVGRRAVGDSYVDQYGIERVKVAEIGGGRDGKAAIYARTDVMAWEALHGPVPDGCTLMIVNNLLPRTPGNLRLVKKEELWEIVTGCTLPPEARELHYLRRQIERAAAKQRQKC